MLLNAGVDPSTNSTVVPKEVFEMTTTSHILATGRGQQPDISASGYGMGWSQFAYQGHEASILSYCVFRVADHISSSGHSMAHILRF